MYSDGVMKGVALGFFRNNIGIQQNTLELCVKTFLFSELYVVERKFDFLSTTPELRQIFEKNFSREAENGVCYCSLFYMFHFNY